MSDQPSTDSPNGLLVPRCRKCGKWANSRCIDGDWWPPCGCGIKYLKYSDEPDSPTPTDPTS